MTDNAIDFATESEVDNAIRELAHGAVRWAALDHRARVEVLRRTHRVIGPRGGILHASA
ncbi:hypothetical protein [Tsukamurella soli]|uniref:Aldehyde dehydrogenase family protein n=1 Tax=Tsukamurella soli TaxID=644556 RepID=A0ABP8J2F3_9ACTN